MKQRAWLSIAVWAETPRVWDGIGSTAPLRAKVPLWQQEPAMVLDRYVVLLVLAALSVTATAFANPSTGLPERADLDRSTPRQTLQLFLRAARAGDYSTAAYALDVRGLPTEGRQQLAEEAARQLHLALDRNVFLDPAAVSDLATGNPADGALTDVVAELPLAGKPAVKVAVTRVALGSGAVWVFSRATVAAAPTLYRERGGGWIESQLPPAIARPVVLGAGIWQWLALLTATPLVLVLAMVLKWLAALVASRTTVQWDNELVARAKKPASWLLVALLLRLGAILIGFSPQVLAYLGRALELAAIASAAWLAGAIIGFLAWLIEDRADHPIATMDPSAARNVRTQVRVLQRVAQVLVIVVAIAIMLLQLPAVRSVGVSLLASAGIVGVLIGFAAQRPVGALLAGIQLSLSRPVRLGDQVVLEGEWGTVEEIRLTHVVVRLFDDRRLVVPITRFLDLPFENWTKVSSELMGTAFIYADYSVPMDLLRAELDRVLELTELWDRRLCVVHVTDTTERCAQIRVMVSAQDASTLFGLRSYVREKLMSWLAEHEGGKYLPQLRHVGIQHAVDPGCRGAR